MYIFGGMADTSTIFQDFYVFDMEASKWTKIKAKGAPPARFGHGAVLVNNQMIVLGGCGKEKEKPYADVYSFRLTTTDNNQQLTNNNYGRVDWDRVVTLSSTADGDNSIGARYHFSLTCLGNCIVVHGGIGKSGEVLNDTIYLSFIKLLLISSQNIL
eukprot:TRINITY_DN15535_c0_g1_i1.p1 TRINITY_DN15535_c0_g1~~TRINITY_DN15535_c0_g1_i1.p1  ORF type:complete len:157 (-),score=28.32 TRINITY_DN15535_c0_g1_i1:282-752(-)